MLFFFLKQNISFNHHLIYINTIQTAYFDWICRRNWEEVWRSTPSCFRQSATRTAFQLWTADTRAFDDEQTRNAKGALVVRNRSTKEQQVICILFAERRRAENFAKGQDGHKHDTTNRIAERDHSLQWIRFSIDIRFGGVWEITVRPAQPFRIDITNTTSNDIRRAWRESKEKEQKIKNKDKRTRLATKSTSERWKATDVQREARTLHLFEQHWDENHGRPSKEIRDEKNQERLSFCSTCCCFRCWTISIFFSFFFFFFISFFISFHFHFLFSSILFYFLFFTYFNFTYYFIYSLHYIYLVCI